MNEKGVFSTFQQACEDVRVCRQAFDAALRDAQDITDAIQARLLVEKVQTAERIEELEEQQRDLARTETGRRIFSLELAQLRARTFEVSGDESATFEAAMLQAQTALADLGKAQKSVREAIAEVEKEMRRMRHDTLGAQDLELMRRWLDGTQKNFDRLGG